MLIGIIDKGYERIHINENNGKVSFIKVNDKINTLNKVEALDVLKDIFNTNNLRYLESNNEYDIYLDLANNKRYFKNGIEDFRMFYDNNGESSVVYNNRKTSDRQKVFSIVTTVGIIATLMLTNDGINNFFVKYINTNASDKVSVIENIDNVENTTTTETIITTEITEVISEEPYTSNYINSAEQIEQFIMESDGLDNIDKQILNNTDYFNFLLSITDEESKLYDFNSRMNNINTQTFTEETSIMEDANGYYIYGTNIIYVRDDCIDDLKKYSDITSHEFIHLTQVSTKYRYLKEALAEILSKEFYDAPISSYLKCVSNVKMLIEVIGPDAVLNGVFSHDTTKFEEAVKQYLTEEECNTFFELLDSTDIYNNETAGELDNKINSIIKEMILRKENNNQAQVSLIEKAASMYNNTRFYFNYNRDEFYKEIEDNIYDTNDIYKSIDNIKEYIESKGTPNNIEIFSLSLNKEQFINNIDAIKKFYIDYNIQSEIIALEPLEPLEKDYDDFIDDTNVEYTGDDNYYKFILTLDEKGNFLNKDEIIDDKELIKEINSYTDLDFTLFCYLNYTWDEFNSDIPKFIYDKQYEADIHYTDGKSISISNDKISSVIIGTITLPPISERFNIEYLNKEKSK